MRKLLTLFIVASIIVSISFVTAQVSVGTTTTTTSAGVVISPPALPPANSSFNQSLSDATYLRLDATNSPVTGQVEFQSGNGKIVTSNAGGAISVQTSTGDPGYISFGNTADIGISSADNPSDYDYDGALIFKQKASNPVEIGEFIWLEETGSWRFALPSAGAGYGTYNPRSLIIAGPSKDNATNFNGTEWGFTNLDMDTSGTGADLGVQDDLQVLGSSFLQQINGQGEFKIKNSSGDVIFEVRNESGSGNSQVIIGGGEPASIFEGLTINQLPRILLNSSSNARWILLDAANGAIDSATTLNLNRFSAVDVQVGSSSDSGLYVGQQLNTAFNGKLNVGNEAQDTIPSATIGGRSDRNNVHPFLQICDFIETAFPRVCKFPWFIINGDGSTLVNSTLEVNDNTTLNGNNFGMGFIPEGGIIDYAGSTVPADFVFANGSLYDRGDKARCFAIIGTTYGNSNASDFRVPNLTASFVVGNGGQYSLGDTGGFNSTTLTGNQSGTQQHTHIYGQRQTTNIEEFGVTTSNGAGGVTGQSTTGDVEQNALDAHDNRPPFIALNKIMRCT